MPNASVGGVSAVEGGDGGGDGGVEGGTQRRPIGTWSRMTSQPGAKDSSQRAEAWFRDNGSPGHLPFSSPAGRTVAEAMMGRGPQHLDLEQVWT